MKGEWIATAFLFAVVLPAPRRKKKGSGLKCGQGDEGDPECTRRHPAKRAG
jgi:hypothetical protein